MRDIAVTFAVFASLPFILKRPWIGILVWTWLGFMNPHRMAWGFSMTMPFAMIVAVTTLTAMLFSREQKRIPWERESVVLLIFAGWMLLTTTFAVYSGPAWEQFDKVVKIQLMIFVAMILINTPERLKALVWTMALSLAFYGVKGGIFTIVHGGVYRVQGPSRTFISGNNELGLAMAMTVPLLFFLARGARHHLVRVAMYSATVLTALGAIGTQSRGALLGMAAMGVVLWLKSRQKMMVALIGAVAVFAVVQIMPESWYARIGTIKTYDADQSAMGRINAWRMAFNLALDRPLGGGFETFRPGMFALYAPDPTDYRDVHSVYFEVLGEHGFVGLFLFLLLVALTWRSASTIARAVKTDAERSWMADLATTIQVSLVAYLTAGAFLGMAYFDFYYSLVLIVVLLKAMLRRDGLLAAPGALGAVPSRTSTKPPNAAIPRHGAPARVQAESAPRA